mmetsp:Transcript_62608/g.186592  ORF Transcript_62608/g.186592 Transcript_62608/m.186592 type:complete len:307 (+) Transcript_62608:1750-2670(+)
MVTAVCTEGSATDTCWKRRSRAASFSMYLRYSSSVVAPMQRSSPLASMGFSRLAASMAPSVFPAPMRRCASSMKRITRPSFSLTSCSTALRRSSNSPRYLAPLIKAPTSSATTLLAFRASGTSPTTMRCARPSTIAVFPTPGSPMRMGLFFVRRARTWITRRISSSRPMTGSSLPASASVTRSRPYLASASKLASPVVLSTFFDPRQSLMACSIWERLKLASESTLRTLFCLHTARKRSGRLRCESPLAACSPSASRRTARMALLGGMLSGAGFCEERPPRSLAVALRSSFRSPPSFESTRLAKDS